KTYNTNVWEMTPNESTILSRPHRDCPARWLVQKAFLLKSYPSRSKRLAQCKALDAGRKNLLCPLRPTGKHYSWPNHVKYNPMRVRLGYSLPLLFPTACLPHKAPIFSKFYYQAISTTAPFPFPY